MGITLMPFQELPFNGDTFVCKEFLRLKELYELNVAVETGSCFYSTTKWLGENFEKVHTVEINAEYAKEGVAKVLGMANVKPEINDSVIYLKNLQLSETDRAIFFLDAHWGQNCPLMEELDAIANMNLKAPPIIVIHDFYTGDENLGWDEYNGQRFDYDWIRQKVIRLGVSYGEYRHYFNTDAEGAKRGVIYLTPKVSEISISLSLSIADERIKPEESIEKLHLDAIEKCEERWSITPRTDIKAAAKKSAEITENIAIEFMNWYWGDKFVFYDSENNLHTRHHIASQGLAKLTTKELFQEYLKERQSPKEELFVKIDEKLERIKYENIVNKVIKWSKYSQSGEEAYIEYLLSNIPPVNNHLVEIGAWDGFHLSNTRFLIEKNWTHLLIDGDNHGNTEVKQHFVTKENILDILISYNTPKKFDFLSLDVDGNDLYILEEILTQYSPTLIVAEFNPIWHPHESKVITYDPTHTWNNDDYYGFSFLAGKKMAAKYGYSCVFQNDSLNMYFVKNAPEMNIQYEVKNYHPRSEKNSWIEY
jgi:hypothetical protein